MPTPGSPQTDWTARVSAVLARVGYNVTVEHMAQITRWVDSTDASIVSQTVAIIEKDYPGGSIASAARKPIFSLLNGSEVDIENSIDTGVLSGISSLDFYLDSVAKAGNA